MLDATCAGFIAESADHLARVLPAEHWEAKQAELGYPKLPDPAFSFLVVVQEKATETIVASWTAMTCTFLEGLHIAPAQRGHASDIHGLLLGGMFGMLQSLNIHHPLTLAQDPAILALARKAGFVPVAGTLLTLE